MPKVYFGKRGGAYILKYGKKVYLSKFGGHLDSLPPEIIGVITPKLSTKEQGSLRKTSREFLNNPSLANVSSVARWPVQTLQEKILKIATDRVDKLILNNLIQSIISSVGGPVQAPSSGWGRRLIPQLDKISSIISWYYMDNYVWANEFYNIASLDNPPSPSTGWYIPFIENAVGVYVNWSTGRGVLPGPIKQDMVPWEARRADLIRFMAIQLQKLPVEDLQ